MRNLIHNLLNFKSLFSILIIFLFTIQVITLQLSLNANNADTNTSENNLNDISLSEENIPKPELELNNQQDNRVETPNLGLNQKSEYINNYKNNLESDYSKKQYQNTIEKNQYNLAYNFDASYKPTSFSKVSSLSSLQANFTGIITHGFYNTEKNPSYYDIVRYTVEIEVFATENYYIEGPFGLPDIQLSHGYSPNTVLSPGIGYLTIDYQTKSFSSLQINQMINLYWLILRDSSNQVIASFNSNNGSIYSFNLTNPNEFEKAEANFSNVSIIPVDTDNNGLYNYLNISSLINNTKGKNYVIDGFIAEKNSLCGYGISSDQKYFSNNFMLNIIIFPRNWNAYGCIGSNSILVLKYLRLNDDQYGGISLFRNTTFFELNVSLFDLPLLSIPYNFQNQVVDTNSNGLIDYIEFSFDINVTVPGNYIFISPLYTTINNWWRSDDFREFNLPAGTSNIYLRFKNFYNYKDINSSYVLNNMRVRYLYEGFYYNFEEFFGNTVNSFTGNYSYIDFEPASAYINNMYFEIAKNNAGISNGLNLVLNITVTQTQKYWIWLRIVFNTSKINKDFQTEYSGEEYLEGTFLKKIFIPFQEINNYLSEDIMVSDIAVHEWKINKLEWEGWYRIFELRNPSSPILYANTYSREDFQHPYGKLYILSDYGLDTNANGLFEYIVIQFKLETNYSVNTWFDIALGGVNFNDNSMGGSYRFNPGNTTIFYKYPLMNFKDRNISEITKISSFRLDGAPDGYPWENFEIYNNVNLTHLYLINQIDNSEFQITNLQSNFIDKNMNNITDTYKIEFDLTVKNGDFGVQSWVEQLSPWCGMGVSSTWISTNQKTTFKMSFEYSTSLLLANLCNFQSLSISRQFHNGNIEIWFNDQSQNNIHYNYRYAIDLYSPVVEESDIESGQINIKLLNYEFKNMNQNSGLFNSINYYFEINSPTTGLFSLFFGTHNQDNQGIWGDERTLLLKEGINYVNISSGINRNQFSTSTNISIGDFQIYSLTSINGLNFRNLFNMNRTSISIGSINPIEWSFDGCCGPDFSDELLSISLNDHIIHLSSNFNYDGTIYISKASSLNITFETNIHNSFNSLAVEIKLLFQQTEGINDYLFPIGNVYMINYENLNQSKLTIRIGFYNQFNEYNSKEFNIELLSFNIPLIKEYSFSPDVIQYKPMNFSLIILKNQASITSLKLKFNPFVKIELFPLVLNWDNGTHQKYSGANLISYRRGVITCEIVFDLGGTSFTNLLDLITFKDYDGSLKPIISNVWYEPNSTTLLTGAKIKINLVTEVTDLKNVISTVQTDNKEFPMNQISVFTEDSRKFEMWTNEITLEKAGLVEITIKVENEIFYANSKKLTIEVKSKTSTEKIISTEVINGFDFYLLIFTGISVIISKKKCNKQS
jgi:hypothetical protein